MATPLIEIVGEDRIVVPLAGDLMSVPESLADRLEPERYFNTALMTLRPDEAADKELFLEKAAILAEEIAEDPNSHYLVLLIEHLIRTGHSADNVGMSADEILVARLQRMIDKIDDYLRQAQQIMEKNHALGIGPPREDFLGIVEEAKATHPDLFPDEFFDCFARMGTVFVPSNDISNYGGDAGDSYFYRVRGLLGDGVFPRNACMLHNSAIDEIATGDVADFSKFVTTGLYLFAHFEKPLLTGPTDIPEAENREFKRVAGRSSYLHEEIPDLFNHRRLGFLHLWLNDGRHNPVEVRQDFPHNYKLHKDFCDAVRAIAACEHIRIEAAAKQARETRGQLVDFVAEDAVVLTVNNIPMSVIRCYRSSSTNAPGGDAAQQKLVRHQMAERAINSAITFFSPTELDDPKACLAKATAAIAAARQNPNDPLAVNAVHILDLTKEAIKAVASEPNHPLAGQIASLGDLSKLEPGGQGLEGFLHKAAEDLEERIAIVMREARRVDRGGITPLGLREGALGTVAYAKATHPKLFPSMFFECLRKKHVLFVPCADVGPYYDDPRNKRFATTGERSERVVLPGNVVPFAGEYLQHMENGDPLGFVIYALVPAVYRVLCAERKIPELPSGQITACNAELARASACVGRVVSPLGAIGIDGELVAGTMHYLLHTGEEGSQFPTMYRHYTMFRDAAERLASGGKNQASATPTNAGPSEQQLQRLQQQEQNITSEVALRRQPKPFELIPDTHAVACRIKKEAARNYRGVSKVRPDQEDITDRMKLLQPEIEAIRSVVDGGALSHVNIGNAVFADDVMRAAEYVFLPAKPVGRYKPKKPSVSEDVRQRARDEVQALVTACSAEHDAYATEEDVQRALVIVELLEKNPDLQNDVMIKQRTALLEELRILVFEKHVGPGLSEITFKPGHSPLGAAATVISNSVTDDIIARNEALFDALESAPNIAVAIVGDNGQLSRLQNIHHKLHSTVPGEKESDAQTRMELEQRRDAITNKALAALGVVELVDPVVEKMIALGEAFVLKGAAEVPPYTEFKCSLHYDPDNNHPISVVLGNVDGAVIEEELSAETGDLELALARKKRFQAHILNMEGVEPYRRVVGEGNASSVHMDEHVRPIEPRLTTLTQRQGIFVARYTFDERIRKEMVSTTMDFPLGLLYALDNRAEAEVRMSLVTDRLSDDRKDKRWATRREVLDDVRKAVLAGGDEWVTAKNEILPGYEEPIDVPFPKDKTEGQETQLSPVKFRFESRDNPTWIVTIDIRVNGKTVRTNDINLHVADRAVAEKRAREAVDSFVSVMKAYADVHPRATWLIDDETRKLRRDATLGGADLGKSKLNHRLDDMRHFESDLRVRIDDQAQEGDELLISLAVIKGARDGLAESVADYATKQPLQVYVMLPLSEVEQVEAFATRVDQLVMKAALEKYSARTDPSHDEEGLIGRKPRLRYRPETAANLLKDALQTALAEFPGFYDPDAPAASATSVSPGPEVRDVKPEGRIDTGRTPGGG